MTLRSVLIGLIALGISPCLSPAWVDPVDDSAESAKPVTVLFDFETTHDLALWTAPGEAAAIRPSAAWATRGSRSARIDFRKWSGTPRISPAGIEHEDDRDRLRAAPQFASVVWAPIGALLAAGKKLSDYDFLEFDARNPQDETIHFDFGLRASTGLRSIPFHISLEPGESRTIRIALRESPVTPSRDNIGRFLSGDEADEFEFRLNFPPKAVSVDVDNIRLVLDPSYRLAPLVDRATDQVDLLPDLIANVNWEQYGHLIRTNAGKVALGEELQELLTRARQLRAEQEGSDPIVWNDITRLRQLSAELIESYDEIIPPEWALLRAVVKASKSSKAMSFVLGAESPLQKVFLEKNRFTGDFPEDHCYELRASRNEAENFQVVVFPLGEALKNVRWEATPLKNAAGVTIPVSVRVVGYVNVQLTPRYAGSQRGWWPDPLLDHLTAVERVPADEVLPLWVTIDVPEEAPAGFYSGALVVSTESSSQRIDIDLEVWDITLPRRSSLPSVNQFYRLGRMEQFDVPREPEETYPERTSEATERFENWLLEYRLQPGSIYSRYPPHWDSDRLKDLLHMGLNAINLGFVRILRQDANNYDEEAHWDRVDEQIERMREYLPVLKEAGIWKNDNVLVYIYMFDEWPGSEIDIVYQTARKLKDNFPEVKLATTAYDRSYGLSRGDGKLIDIWVPHVNVLGSNQMHIQAASSRGREFWWYFALGAFSPYPNYYWIENPTIEGRLAMGTLTYKHRLAGFLYWAVNRWFNNDPERLTNGPLTSWYPHSVGDRDGHVVHGEGSLFYARPRRDGEGTEPVSSIRLESYRDGMEDYEYFVKLEGLRRRAGISQARVSIPREIVENVGEFTGDPSLLDQQKQQLAEEILELERALPPGR